MIPKMMTITGTNIKEVSIFTVSNVTRTKAGRVILKIIFAMTSPSFSCKTLTFLIDTQGQ